MSAGSCETPGDWLLALNQGLDPFQRLPAKEREAVALLQREVRDPPGHRLPDLAVLHIGDVDEIPLQGPQMLPDGVAHHLVGGHLADGRQWDAGGDGVRFQGFGSGQMLPLGEAHDRGTAPGVEQVDILEGGVGAERGVFDNVVQRLTQDGLLGDEAGEAVGLRMCREGSCGSQGEQDAGRGCDD